MPLGVIGRYIVEKLVEEPDWRVVGLSRRNTMDRPCYRHVAVVDLLDTEGDLTDVTHVFFAAFQAASGSAADFASNTSPNREMLVNSVTAINRAAPHLKRVVPVTRTKYYGVHLGPVKTPMRETDPRHMPHHRELLVVRNRAQLILRSDRLAHCLPVRHALSGDSVNALCKCSIVGCDRSAVYTAIPRTEITVGEHPIGKLAAKLEQAWPIRCRRQWRARPDLLPPCEKYQRQPVEFENSAGLLFSLQPDTMVGHRGSLEHPRFSIAPSRSWRRLPAARALSLIKLAGRVRNPDGRFLDQPPQP